MSKIEYNWINAAPTSPDVYMTRRNESKYLTLRYWDGTTWFELAWGGRRGGQLFSWPKGSRTKRPSWAVKYKDTMRLRKISAYLGEIQWGIPFKVYDEKETLAWRVARGVIREDWRTAYQAEMRSVFNDKACKTSKWSDVIWSLK